MPLETKLFNQNWVFKKKGSDVETTVCIPHTTHSVDWHSFDDSDIQHISLYKKIFNVGADGDITWNAGEKWKIRFNGVMMKAVVYVNQKQVYVHEGGFTPFTVDITESIKMGANEILLEVDSHENKEIPPFGNVVDYLAFSGIYREVVLERYSGKAAVEHIRITQQNLLEPEKRVISVNANVLIESPFNGNEQFLVRCTLYDLQEVDDLVTMVMPVRKEVYSEQKQIIYSPSNLLQTASFEWKNLQSLVLWEPHNPHLYRFVVEVSTASDGTLLDQKIVNQFGFREVAWNDYQIVLNGKPLKLFGLNRHQNYPFIGCAAGKRLQRFDAETLKYRLGCNIVRTSHYPQSRHFLDRCDEIGLLVLEEIPGWQFIGDGRWKEKSLRNVEEMIMRDEHHPSIVLWGIRINESKDDDEFYTKANTIAHKLDPTRKTTGTRYFQDSHFLEDVFSYNDFSNSVEEPVNHPHLITEFGGHMYPTKSFDCIERRVDQALLHAKVHNLQLGNAKIAGALGWCAFDYNTHREFGSGDRVCYHGVMDIFRRPKIAAHFYESQQNHANGYVLRVGSNWSMGDRSGGGNHPLWVFSNCNKIQVLVGSSLHGTYEPDRETFPHLKYPPFKVLGLENMLWGADYGDLHIRGLDDKGHLVVEKHIENDGVPRKLDVRVISADLIANGSDQTMITVTATDKYLNTLPYANNVIEFSLEGAGEITPKITALSGGVGCAILHAPYLKDLQQNAVRKATLTIRNIGSLERPLPPIVLPIRYFGMCEHC